MANPKTKQQKETAEEQEAETTETAPARQNEARPLVPSNFRMGAEGLIDPASGEQIPLSEVDKKLENAQKGMELTSEYHEFSEGEELRCVYIGDTHITGQNDELVPAVRFYVAGEEKMKINASNVMVSTLTQHPPFTAFYIYCKGKVQGKNGKYFDLKVQELIAPE